MATQRQHYAASFRAGDLVEVVAGYYRGQVGTVAYEKDGDKYDVELENGLLIEARKSQIRQRAAGK